MLRVSWIDTLLELLEEINVQLEMSVWLQVGSMQHSVSCCMNGWVWMVM